MRFGVNCILDYPTNYVIPNTRIVPILKNPNPCYNGTCLSLIGWPTRSRFDTSHYLTQLLSCGGLTKLVTFRLDKSKFAGSNFSFCIGTVVIISYRDVDEVDLLQEFTQKVKPFWDHLRGGQILDINSPFLSHGRIYIHGRLSWRPLQLYITTQNYTIIYFSRLGTFESSRRLFSKRECIWIENIEEEKCIACHLGSASLLLLIIRGSGDGGLLTCWIGKERLKPRHHASCWWLLHLQ